MKQLYWVIVLILIIWVFCFFPKPQIENTQEIRVTKSGVIIKTPKGTKVIPIPRTGEIKITSTEVTEIGLFPKLCFLPNIGLATGSQILPLIGVQLLRSDPIGLGIAVNLTTENLSLSLDKDVFYNSILGIYYGINKGGYSQIGLLYSLYI